MKPKREITLGEMQDECEKRDHLCQPKCPYSAFCGSLLARSPSKWDLTDPPRFTEAQMALLRALWDIGVVKLERWNKYDSSYYAESTKYGTTSLLTCDWFGETVWKIDLAELFGTVQCQ